MRLRRALLMAVFVIGCGKTVKPTPPAEEPPTVVETARERPVPEVLQSRFHIKLQSDKLDLAGSTGGGLVVDLPDRVRADIFGPLGGTLVTVASDGEEAEVILYRAGRHLVADEADAVMREATGGAAGMPDLLGLLVGQLPFPDAELRSLTTLDEGTVRATLDGPKDTVVEAYLDPHYAVPLRLEALDAEGTLMVSAAYESFEEVEVGEVTYLLPAQVHLRLPGLDLDVTVRYRGWSVPDEPPDVFDPEAPDNAVREDLEGALRGLGRDVIPPGERPSP